MQDFFIKHKIALLFWILAIITFCARIYINFSGELLIGNGGYYPLQVRTILERGELAFPDMPLLFYLNAGIVKTLSFFGANVTDILIIHVVQIVDSISIPLLLIPIYQILKLTKNNQFSLFTILVAAYSVLSFYTLTLTTTSQKNSLGITLLLFSFCWLIKHIKTAGDKKHLILSLLFLLLTGLTHFGTFIFAIIAGVVYLGFRYKYKAVIPLFIMVISSLFIIYWSDPTRLYRLTTIFDELLTTPPRPPQLILLIIYSTMAMIAYKGFKKYRDHFDATSQSIIKTLIALLVIIPLPIINPQFTDRLSMYLFIPQVLLLLFFTPLLQPLAKKIFTGMMSFVIVVSLLFGILIGSPQSLSKAALLDLKNLETGLSATDKTVIITRHNLEFWVAWTMKVDVSQESKFDSILEREYDHIFVLNQTKGLDKKEGPPRDQERNHFDEPIVPSSAILVDSSEYFKLYQFK